MKLYDVYFFGHQSGVIVRWEKFAAEDDAAAIEIARDWAGDAPLELWEAQTRVKRWDAAA